MRLTWLTMLTIGEGVLLLAEEWIWAFALLAVQVLLLSLWLSCVDADVSGMSARRRFPPAPPGSSWKDYEA